MKKEVKKKAFDKLMSTLRSLDGDALLPKKEKKVEVEAEKPKAGTVKSLEVEVETPEGDDELEEEYSKKSKKGS